MDLYTNCTSCKKEIKVKSNAKTRAELQMEVGDEISLNCQNCGNFIKRHVNKVRAKSSNTIMLLGVGLGVVFTVVLWYFYGAIGTASIGIPIIIWQLQEQVIRGFNSYMIKRK